MRGLRASRSSRVGKETLLEDSQDDSRYETGMKVRRAVLGDAYVDRAVARTTELDADFQRFVTETAWGSLWARPDLDRRTRSLITIAILAALGRHEELAVHMRGSRNTGATPQEVVEALLHVAVYGGIPAANAAFTIARSALASPEAGHSRPRTEKTRTEKTRTPKQ
jgi:4-carboxymuconolactone decarboxylase